MTGAEFRAIRKHLRMTQADLALRMGYNFKQAISRIEKMESVPAYAACHIREIKDHEDCNGKLAE